MNGIETTTDVVQQLVHALIFALVIMAVFGIVEKVDAWWRTHVAKHEEAFECCEHCGCRPTEQRGHSFACSQGCNDERAEA